MKAASNQLETDEEEAGAHPEGHHTSGSLISLPHYYTSVYVIHYRASYTIVHNNR